MGIIRGALKLGILSGTVYLTVDQGIWSNSKTTTEILQKVPYVTLVAEQYVDQFSWTSEVTGKAADYWNSGVQYTFSALAELPGFVSNGIATGITATKDALKSLSQ